ncbi:hypothetical protein [Spirosoma litoris]
MGYSHNIYLLKEYIKTFIATDFVFPGILPRQWGHEFTSSELKGIYFGLNFVLLKAHPLQDIDMIDAFNYVEESNLATLHWFLCDYWETIVVLLKFYPDLGEEYLTNLN